MTGRLTYTAGGLHSYAISDASGVVGILKRQSQAWHVEIPVGKLVTYGASLPNAKRKAAAWLKGADHGQ